MSTDLPVINFSWNWNGKLFCRYFTTIRIHNTTKYQVGRQYAIQLNNRDMGPGIIREIDSFRLAQFTNKMAAVDMGMPLDKAKSTILTMYKNKGFNWETQLFDFILIEQPDKVVQLIPEELFGRYVDAESPEAVEFLNAKS